MTSSQVARTLEETVTCESCLEDLEHCHGVAIVTGFEVVCSDDPDCALSLELHHFTSYEDDASGVASLRD